MQNQPSQRRRSTDVVNFRLPRAEADALRRLADARTLTLSGMLQQHTSPLVALAVDLDV